MGGERYPSLKQLATAASGIVDRHPASCRCAKLVGHEVGCPCCVQEDARLSTCSYVERHGGVTTVVESPMWAVERVSDATPHPSADRAVNEAADLLRDGCAQVADLLAEVATILPAARDPLLSAAREALAFGPKLADHWALEALPGTAVAHVTEVEIMARRVPLRAAAMLSQLLRQATPCRSSLVGRTHGGS